MGIFEFVVGLYAIIAGLGISLLVESVGQMIEGRRRLHFYWVQTLWIALIFGAHITSWFAFWHFAKQEQWTPLEVMLALAMPILLYLVSHLAVPDLTDDRRETDLRAYYFEHHRWMQGLLIASLVVAQVAQHVILGEAFESPDFVRIVAIAVLVPGLLFSKPWIHATQALLLATLLLLALSFAFAPIG